PGAQTCKVRCFLLLQIDRLIDHHFLARQKGVGVALPGGIGLPRLDMSIEHVGLLPRLVRARDDAQCRAAGNSQYHEPRAHDQRLRGGRHPKKSLAVNFDLARPRIGVGRTHLRVGKVVNLRAIREVHELGSRSTGRRREQTGAQRGCRQYTPSPPRGLVNYGHPPWSPVGTDTPRTAARHSAKSRAFWRRQRSYCPKRAGSPFLQWSSLPEYTRERQS